MVDDIVREVREGSSNNQSRACSFSTLNYNQNICREIKYIRINNPIMLTLGCLMVVSKACSLAWRLVLERFV